MEHTNALARDRARTEDFFTVWPHTAAATPEAENTQNHTISRAQKEAIRRQGLLNADGDLATPYRRLKLVMDYWCALWFWPITQSSTLPSREAWWMEVGAILEGSIVDLDPQPSLDLRPTEPEAAQVIFHEVQPVFEGFETQLPLSQAADQPNLHDKLGQLRISKLRLHFARIPQVEAVAEARRFLHWDLCFADILLHRGGFDLILGNPPWLKVEWNEAGILGEYNPMFAIRKISASDLTGLRTKAFNDFPGLQNAWTDELQELVGTQKFVNAKQNYPLLAGMHANLYKCFIPLGWRLANNDGVIGYLHPGGPYEDPEGGELRESIYRRLRLYFQFQNELKLFPIGNRAKFGINIYSNKLRNPDFDLIGNLFSPSTIDACYLHDGGGLAGGIKNGGKWNIEGHKDRIVRVNLETLKTFSDLYDQVGTLSSKARLPIVHAGKLSSVLEKLSKFKTKIASLGDSFNSTFHWGETSAQDNGTMFRRKLNPESVSRFPARPIFG